MMSDERRKDNSRHKEQIQKEDRMYRAIQEAGGTNSQLADVREQAEIVRQRLEYHFRSVDGGFMVPDFMPFMKEFLGALDTLLEKIEHVI